MVFSPPMPASLLYHNPRCSKSRAALALLQERGVEVEVVLYLKAPLDRKALLGLGQQLGLPPREWIRDKEAAYREAGLSERSSDEELFEAMALHPILMERPILVRGRRAIVGRPPERVLDLL